eukprot:76668_1
MASIGSKHTLVTGYFRENCPATTSGFVVPRQIIKTCLMFTTPLYQTLTFSDTFKSAKGFVFFDDRQCVRKLDNYPRTTWILSDVEPVYDGIHCWRIFIKNPQQEYLKVGVSGKKMFEDNNLNQDTVWGIARSKTSNYYKPHIHSHKNNIDLEHFIEREIAIDMYLDAHKGLMKLCVVGMCTEDKEARLWNMPTSETEGWQYGWVPHFMFGTNSKNTELRIMEIYHEWYGLEQHHLSDAIIMESESFV